MLAYLHLLRVPLLIFLGILLFPVLASVSGPGAYLVGMYDISGWPALSGGAACGLLWLALSVTTNNVLREAHDKLSVTELPQRLQTPINLPVSLNLFNFTGWRISVLAA